ncbi:MAG TPA: tetratricopeptide repeat protein, partial [Turneriella sp.]|nr:tetratricopeptide repeat protein [Turneriella sp.]
DDFDAAPAKTPTQQFNAGLSAFAAQQFDEALAAYEDALSLGGASDPVLHEKLLYELGRTYVKKNNAKSAVEKFSELLRTFAHGTLARKTMIQLAEIYERAKDTNRAAALYEKAAQMPPQDKEANIAHQKANQLRGRK